MKKLKKNEMNFQPPLPPGIVMENNAYRVKPTGDCKGAVIFLHGLGDSGEGWSSVSY